MALKWLYMSRLAHRTGAILVPVRCAKLLNVSLLSATLVGRRARSALLRFLFDEAVAQKANAECGDEEKEIAKAAKGVAVKQIDGKKDVKADVADGVFCVAGKLHEVLLTADGGNEGVNDSGEKEQGCQNEEDGFEGFQVLIQKQIAQEQEGADQLQSVQELDLLFHTGVKLFY